MGWENAEGHIGTVNMAAERHAVADSWQHPYKVPKPPPPTTARAVPLAEEPVGVVLVVSVLETAEALPEALALDHPEGSVILPMARLMV